MPYEFTKLHRKRLSESLKGTRNAAGPHEMTPRGRGSLRLAQLKRWLAFYQSKAKAEKDPVKRAKLMDKADAAQRKVEIEERRQRRYGWI